MSSRFTLDTALSAWRRSLEYNRAFSADDLDELEQHLRDQIAGLAAQGLSEEAAYEQALREMGDYGTAEAEYRKVFWGKRRREGGLSNELQWRLSMLANYLKIAYRTLLRQKGYSFLNVTGLAVGLACAFRIAIWIRDEASYDRFHDDGDRLYRVMRHVHSGDDIRTSDIVTWNIARVLEEEYPEVEDVVVVTERVNIVIQRGRNLGPRMGSLRRPCLFRDVLLGPHSG